MTILRVDRRVVRRVTPALLAGLRAPIKSVAVDRTPAATALTRTLENGPVTIFALGPLTNAAHVLTTSPHLVSNVDELMAVMGRRPGHLFHPSEGIGRGSLLGHGPVFRDFTFSGDPEAAEQLLCLGRERFYTAT
jgi:purine nucleosidase